MCNVQFIIEIHQWFPSKSAKTPNIQPFLAQKSYGGQLCVHAYHNKMCALRWDSTISHAAGCNTGRTQALHITQHEKQTAQARCHRIACRRFCHVSEARISCQLSETSSRMNKKHLWEERVPSSRSNKHVMLTQIQQWLTSVWFKILFIYVQSIIIFCNQ